MKNVRRLCDELGKTVILVLHEINYAAFYSDYICAFKDGRIAKFGKVEMENAGVWYKAEGGFTALGIMLADLETALGIA